MPGLTKINGAEISASYALTASYVINSNDTTLGNIISYQLSPSTQNLTFSGSGNTGSFSIISASFITPSNGKILIELSNLGLSSQNTSPLSVGSRNYQIGLSSTPNSFTTVKDYKTIFALPEAGGGIDNGFYEVSSKWVITGLTPAQSYTYYFFCKALGVTDFTPITFTSTSGQTTVIMTSLP